MLDTAAVQASLTKLREFLDHLDAIPANPVSSTVADWRGRLEGVQNQEQLATVVLELEADINDLGSGLPTGDLYTCPVV
jgi:hypothetical protein